MLRNAPTPEIEYIRNLYAAQDALLASIGIELERRNIAIQIGPEEGKLLQVLMNIHNARNVVEVGTLAGYSTIWMARALPNDGQIYTINKDPAHVQMAEHFFAQCECKRRITHLEGDAHKVLPALSAKAPFDMIFIDADKISYNDYLDWAEKNIRKGGLIVADNTLLGGVAAMKYPPQDFPKTRFQNIQRFNERLADKSKYNSIIIPTREGLSVAVKLF